MRYTNLVYNMYTDVPYLNGFVYVMFNIIQRVTGQGGRQYLGNCLLKL